MISFPQVLRPVFQFITFSSCFWYKSLHQLYQERLFYALNMEYDMDMSQQLVDELVELWVETKVRCDKIEDIIKQLKETEKIRHDWLFK